MFSKNKLAKLRRKFRERRNIVNVQHALWLRDFSPQQSVDFWCEEQKTPSQTYIDFCGIKLFASRNEDIISAKLFLGSEQEMRDAAFIFIEQNGKLDLPYLRAACEKLGVKKDLKKMEESVKKILAKLEKK